MRLRMEKLNGVEKRASRDFIASLGYRDVGITFPRKLSFGGVSRCISMIVSNRHSLDFNGGLSRACWGALFFIVEGIGTACDTGALSRTSLVFGFDTTVFTCAQI